MRKTIIDVAAGLAGGALGTLLLLQGRKLSGKLPQRFQPRVKKDPAEHILSTGEKLIGRPLPKREKLKPALGWIYGMTGPLVLGAVASRVGRGSLGRTLAAGAAMGGIVWAVGYLGWMPRAGVVEPIGRQRLEATASTLASHAAYGLVSALPVALAERFA
jgi:hypothetical protein